MNTIEAVRDARFRAPSPQHSHHHLRYACRFCKIILGNEQITLLGDAWRIAKPGANYMQGELALEFGLSAGPHRVEQSWPTRDSGAAKQSRHPAA